MHEKELWLVDEMFGNMFCSALLLGRNDAVEDSIGPANRDCVPRSRPAIPFHMAPPNVCEN
jgi:hypothetical protein